MNFGTCQGVQILRPESIALMHQTLPDSDYGLGWSHDRVGAQGHQGSELGYRSDMQFRENLQGPYGIILLVNRECNKAQDEAFVNNYEAIYDLLMAEAAQLQSQLNLPPPVLVIGGLTTLVIVVVILGVVVFRRQKG